MKRPGGECSVPSAQWPVLTWLANSSQKWATALLVFGLSGCGGVFDRTCVDRVVVHTHHARRQITISIRQPYTGRFQSEQRLATDSRGEILTSFQSPWSGVYIVPLGSIPRRPPKPEYLVLFAGRRLVLSPAAPDTRYRWRDDGWLTATILHP